MIGNLFSFRRVSPVLFLTVLAQVCAGTCYVITEGEHTGPVRIEVAGDAITAVEPLGAGFPVADPHKAAISNDGGYLLMGAGGSEEPQVILYPLADGEPQRISLNGEVSDLAAAGEGFFVASSRGRFYFVDTDGGGSATEWRARRELDPPGRKGEHVKPLADAGKVLVSFQKDDDDSPAQGNRIVVFNLDPLSAEQDLLLPRTHQELHIEGNLKEQGPSPEIIVVAPRANTMAVTLDLYGAVAMADLDGVLAGEWRNLEYISSAADEEWGVAFPDRAALIEIGDRDLMLVSNASRDGGFALFDLGAREKIAHLPAPVGAETPLWFPAVGKAVSVLSGKVKARPTSGIELSNEREPVPAAVFFDFSNFGEDGAPSISRLELDDTPVRSAAAGENSALVFVDTPSGGGVLLIDIAEERVLDQKALPGRPVRVALNGESAADTAGD